MSIRLLMYTGKTEQVELFGICIFNLSTYYTSQVTKTKLIDLIGICRVKLHTNSQIGMHKESF